MMKSSFCSGKYGRKRWSNLIAKYPHFVKLSIEAHIGEHKCKHRIQNTQESI